MVTMQILAASGQPDDFSDFTILRHNYGVVIKKASEAQIATDYWTHVFTVELPTVGRVVDTFIPTCDRIVRSNSTINHQTCVTIRPMLGILAELNENMTKHLNETMKHIVNVLPTHFRSVDNRQTRALIGVVGEILRGAFGTMSDSDRENIDARVRQIVRTQVGLTKSFESEQAKMSSYFSVANKRMDTVAKLVTDQHKVIDDVLQHIAITARETTVSNVIVSTAISRLTRYITIMDHINDLRVAVERLVEGYLTPSLIPPASIDMAIRSIQQELASRFPDVRLIRYRAKDIYAHANHLYAR